MAGRLGGDGALGWLGTGGMCRRMRCINKLHALCQGLCVLVNTVTSYPCSIPRQRAPMARIKAKRCYYLREGRAVPLSALYMVHAAWPAGHACR